MNHWILTFNDDSDGAPYFPHEFSHKHGVLFADQATASKALNSLANELFSDDWTIVESKGTRVVIEGRRVGFGDTGNSGWVMIELHDVRGAVEEKPQTPVPAVGDKAVLVNENTHEQDKGWTVRRLTNGGKRVSISKNMFFKYLDRIPDGRYHHQGDVYATFEPAQAPAEVFPHTEPATITVTDTGPFDVFPTPWGAARDEG